MAVIHLNDGNFEKEVLNSKEPVIVDYWASWCGPCRVMAPRFEELSNEMKGIKFAKLSTEEAPEIASQHEIMSIPTLVLFKGGKEEDRMIGALPKEYLKAWLEKHL
ncbi:thioredoxin [Candidatus Micrarchaeota archaeon]|nr:thioredoxin [Candidatus Micrarchaeota archaeon]